jgi:hypothetical protein
MLELTPLLFNEAEYDVGSRYEVLSADKLCAIDALVNIRRVATIEPNVECCKRLRDLIKPR